MLAPSNLTRHLMVLSAITLTAACSRPTPAPTATPVAVAQAAEYGYRDDFSDRSSGWRPVWPLLLETPHGAEYADGAYRIWIDNDQGSYDIVVASSGRTYDDVLMEVDVRRVEGEPYAGAFLLCRLDIVSGSFYYFKLDGDGIASIGYYLEGEDQRTVFQEVPAHLGVGETVRFGASCLGSKLAVTVDGETVFEWHEASLASGQIGLGAGEGDEGRTEILFDNFVAEPLGSEQAAASFPEGEGSLAPDEGTLTPFDGEPPPPEGVVDAMAERVASGEWTTEQALITNLKLFAGELRLDQVYGVAPESLEGFGLVLEASRYAASGPDAAAREEIVRLLGILLPPSDRLREYADPEPTAGIGRSGLAILPPLQEDCEKLYAKGFPPGSGIKCLLYKQSGIGGQTVTTYYPLVALPLEYAEAAHQAVLTSWSTFNALKGGLSSTTMGSVDLVFVLLPYVEAPTVLALVPSLAPDPTCKITVFLGAIQANEKAKSGPNDYGRFQQTVAHEMFHCYQQWNFPEHFPNQADSSDWAVQDWWGEGTAEYFSNVAYPTVNDEWGRIPGFDYKSASKSLVELSYNNTVFFQYMANTLTNDGLLKLLHGLPYSGSEQDQAAALSKWPAIEQHFHDFGRAFFDGKIKDSSGALLPSGPPVVLDDDYLSIFESQIRLMEARPFVLKRVAVFFPQGHRYSISAVTKGSLPGLDAVRRGAAAGFPWGEWPPQLAAGCKDAVYLMMMTSTAPSPSGTFAVELTLTRDEPVVCDACIAGQWRLLHESLADYLAAPFAGTPGFFTYVDGGGLWIYTFTSAGGISTTINYALGYELNQGSETLPVVAQVVLTIAGKGAGSYWVMLPGTLAMEASTSNIKMEQTIAINGQIAAGDSPIAFNPLPLGTSSVDYECSPTTLLLWPAAAEQAGMPPLAFERFGNAP